jgi:CubicO group peptidase (beta-lactamase class C family)
MRMTRRTMLWIVVVLSVPAVVVSTSMVRRGAALGDPGPSDRRAASPPPPQPPAPGRWSAGGEPDDPHEAWPEPELRAGLSEAQIGASIAAYAKQLSDAGHFSGVILAAHAGNVVMTHAYGLANAASSTPNTTETKFNIGSLGKLFTTVAILQLAQAGKLSLDDTVRKHLPELPLAAADRISIGQLLDHRSGLGDFFGPRFEAAPPSRLRELGDFVPLFVDQPLAFAPGSSERYSNAGYLVLGLLVERISGEKYRDYVVKHICAPAKMTSTGFWAVDERVPDRATGYTRHGKDQLLSERIPNTAMLSGRPESAGGAFATAADLLRFWNAVLADQLLSRPWTNWMLNRRFDVDRRPTRGGFGGAFDGVNAFMEMTPGWTVIALANLDPPSAQAVTHGAIEIIRGHRDPAPPGGPGIRRIRPPDKDLERSQDAR